MTRRLLLGYLGVTLFVLRRLEVPLGVQNQRTERRDLTAKVSHDAMVLAADAEDAVQRADAAGSSTRSPPSRPRYRSRTGGRVVIVDRRGHALIDTSGARPRRRELRVAPRDRGGARRAISARRPHVEDAARAAALRRRADRVRRAGARRRPDHVSDLGRRRANPPLLADPRADRRRRARRRRRRRHRRSRAS